MKKIRLFALLASVAVILTTFTLSATAATYVPPSTISSNCSSDVTSSLNSWLSSLPNGSSGAPTIASLPANACYRVEGTLNLTNRSWFSISGNNATVKATTQGSSGRAQFRIVGGNDITISNLIAQGVAPGPNYNPSYEWQHNFGVNGTRNLTLDTVTGKNAYGDFVSLDPDQRSGTPIPPTNTTIRNSTFSVAGRQGISCTYCQGLTIDHNNLDYVGQSVIDLESEGATWTIRDVRITNNTVGHRQHHFVADYGYPASQSNIYIGGNNVGQVSNTCLEPIHGENNGSGVRTGYVIENNTLTSADNAAVRFTHTNDIKIRNNTIKWVYLDCAHSYTVATLASVNTASITGNDALGGTRVESHDSASTNITACGNRLTSSGFNQPVPCSSSSPTPTQSPSPTATATVTPSPTPTPTPSPSPTPTPSPSPTQSKCTSLICIGF